MNPIVNGRQFKEYIRSEGYQLFIVAGKDGKIVQVERGTSPKQRDKLRQTIRSLR